MSALRQPRVSAKLDSCLGRLGKPFVHFFLIGEQLLTARALLHALEMSVSMSRAIRPSGPASTVADLFDETFVRVDPWLGIRFNLAMHKKIGLVLIVLLGTALNSFAQTNSTPGAPTAGIVAATKKFLATLDDAQRGRVVFDFKDEAQRKRWSNLPTAIFKRQGLRMGDLTKPQREAALAVLAAALSPQGYTKVLQIVEADDVLRKSSGEAIFGRDEYYVSILGQPSMTEPWMIQFGGHHLGLNITLAGEQRTLSSLNETQRKQAILDFQMRDLVLGPGRDGQTIQPEGIKGAALTEKQRQILLDLASEWTGIMHEAVAKAKMDEMRNNIAETWFAWSGPTEKGSAAYFRIQGPTVIIEYAPQRLGGDATKHIHTIYRDPTNDYGIKWSKP